jgi:hypothetical protein
VGTPHFNNKTIQLAAKALGIAVSTTTLGRADKVIG